MGKLESPPIFIDRQSQGHAHVRSWGAGRTHGWAEAGQDACAELALRAECSRSHAVDPFNEFTGRQLRMQLRMIFRLVDQFTRLYRLDSERYRVQGIVQDLVVVVRECFATAAVHLPDASASVLDQEQCIHDLEDLSRVLGLGHPISARELAHALDAVVVSCIVLDSEQGEIEKARLELAADQAR